MTRSGEQPVRLEPRVERIAELTRTQSDIWTSQRLHPSTPLANMGKRTRIAGVVDAERFVRAFDVVVRRCEVLRTVVGDRSTSALQNAAQDRAVAIVRAAPPAATEVIDLPAAELDQWCAARIAVPIDATRCVYDSVLIRHGDDDWTWWLDLHHIATDAWSSALIFEATSAAYLDGGRDVDLLEVVDGRYYADPASPGDPPGEHEADEHEAARRAAWLEEAESAGPQPPIEPYGARGARTTQVRRLPVPFSADDRHHLQAALDSVYRTLSRELGLLTIAAMSTAISVHRLDGRSSVVLGVPVHHRSARDARRVVGPLMELYPLTVAVESGETHRAMFERVMASIVALLRRAKPGESPAGRFEIVLNVLTARYGSFAEMPAVSEWMRSGHVDPAHVLRSQVFDYTADSSSTTDLTELNWELDVNSSLSADGASARFPDHFAAVVRDVIEVPDEPVGARSIVGGGELAELAALSPDPSPREHTEPVHEQIARRLRADPSWIVAEHDGDELTAGDLDRRADQLARWLIDAGVSPGRAVGVRMARSLDVLVAIHGVLRSGGAFVMFSPDEPAARVESIATDADVLLTLDRLPETAGLDAEVDLPPVGLDDRAYVLYTSGSTGEPKGVPISHLGLADYLASAVEAYVDGDPPVVALHSRLTVDLTITSLFISTMTGGLTVIFDAEPITALGRIAADDRITFLKATPSQLELFVRLVDEPRPLRTIVVGGEAFRTPIARRTAESCAPGVRIFNEYGPTEAVVGCMIHRFDPELDAGADVPIGAAAPGTRLAILDPFGHPAPTGAWGELYVQRPGMADGYLGRPALSAERFVMLPDAVDPSGVHGDVTGRWYRTGDRVRVVRPGVAVYGGRMDDQIKVDGMRLEPGEVEAALVTFQPITSALVRIWQPGEHGSPGDHARCTRCGLGTDVPGVELDDRMVCNTCRSFDMVAPQTERWFRSEADLDRRLVEARRKRRGDVDCLHLLSGGKDSTYALYQLVERGWNVHALTLDNGFISEGAKENVRRSVADLGITHEFAETSSMNEIFRDSLDRHSNVCQGCYKTIYTLAVARAHELGIPVIVTGLSRGQFFETRLVPHQFEAGRFDPDAIDETVLEARRVYHRTADAVTELLPEQRVFDDDRIFDEIEFVDFYRYVDVELSELYRYLEERAPWVRPADTGRSTNCLINIAGIQVHRSERGYHNYAEPYSWDVRLGHKTRDEALEELDDEIDEAEVLRLLAEVGYEPKTKGVLTAWYQSNDGADVDPDAIREHLRTRLPAHAVPAAFVRVDEMPLAASAKVDPSLLPAPTRFDRSRGDRVEPATPLESRLCEIWAAVLGLEEVGAMDDFFDLGGASLDALEVVEAIDSEFGVDLPDAAVFRAPTVRTLAPVVQRTLDDAGDEAALISIPALDPQRPPPLSAGEEAMLFEHRMAPDDPRYNVTRLYRIELPSAASGFDTAAFSEAVGAVVMTHGPLHTSYGADRRRLPIAEAIALTELPSMTPDEFERFALRQRAVRFDLDAGPLVRVHLSRTGPDEVSLLVALHHISVDAGTFDLMWDQIVERYDTGTLPELRTSYAEHGQWQRLRPSDSAGFWQERSRRRRITGGLALAAPSPPEEDGYLSRRCAASPAVLNGPGRTPFASAMAAMAVVMSRYTATGHVSFGITASTKDHRDAAPLVGYYLNTLPVELDVRPTARFGDLVADAGAFVGEALPHRAYPFASIVRDARASGHAAPSVSSMLAYEDLATPAFPGGAVEQRILASGSSVADATFFVQERATSLQLGLEYRGSVIGRSDAERMMSLFESVLLDGSADPGRSIGLLTAGSAAEDIVGELLEPTERTVLDDFLARVDERPDHPAVVAGDGETLSYQELAAAAQRVLALVDAASPDHAPRRVGVILDRSTDLLAAIVAAQSAGAAYVPLDPSAPTARLARIAALADLDLVILRDGSEIDAQLLGVPEHRVIALDAYKSRPDIDLGDLRTRIDRVTPEDDAYVIFTSGSTGQPRGVEVTHRNLSASTRARGVWYPEAPSRFLVTPSIGFDSSIVGLIWPLATGGTVVLPSDDDVRDIDRIGATIAMHGVTHTLMVPSLYRAVLERCFGELQSLRTAIVAGESCAQSLVALHEELLPGVALVNEYGPTEATVWATAARLDGADEVSIGRPIAGSTVRIVDRYLTPVPEGVAGELLIAGPGVAKGYLDDPPSTAARFVSSDGRRWYRTGDLVRVVDDRIEFVGRADDQLNVGGTRLEPGEVESALTTRPEIRDAVVVAAMDPPILVAHVESEGFDEGALRESLSARLPNGSIPRRFVRHERLPRNPNGKVDRAAAARLPVGRPDEEPRSLASPDAPATIDIVLRAWGTALARTDIGADTDFFAIGGDSLSAVEVVTAIGERLDQLVPIATLLTGRTPEGMTELLDRAEVADVAPAHLPSPAFQAVTLQPGAAGGPLILMTPAWDDVFGYQALAAAFPDACTVVALAYVEQADEPVVTTVDELVREFLPQAMNEIDVRSTVAVVGWSVGGVVAVELTERLSAAGRPVELVALIDTFFPGEERHLWSNRWSKYKSLLRPGSFGEARRELRVMTVRRVKRLAERLGRRLLIWSGATLPKEPERTSVGGFPVQALAHDVEKLHTPLVFYRASTTNPERTLVKWRTVADEVVDVEIPGRHRGYNSIMGAKGVGLIASDLVGRLPVERD